MEVMPPVPSLNELILSFHAGKPYLMWIHFDQRYGEQPCSLCRMP